MKQQKEFVSASLSSQGSPRQGGRLGQMKLLGVSGRWSLSGPNPVIQSDGYERNAAGWAEVWLDSFSRHLLISGQLVISPYTFIGSASARFQTFVSIARLAIIR